MHLVDAGVRIKANKNLVTNRRLIVVLNGMAGHSRVAMRIKLMSGNSGRLEYAGVFIRPLVAICLAVLTHKTNSFN